MTEQVLILVDKENNKLGYAPRSVCHSGDGKMHRAFVVMLQNDRGKFLLQKRRHALWDGFWDVSATSHTLHLEGKDETYEEAAQRCLMKELNMRAESFKNLGAFVYFAKRGENCENEHCSVLIARTNSTPKPNPEEVYELEWTCLEMLIMEIHENPKKFTPWLVETVKLLSTGNYLEFLHKCTAD